MIAKSVTPNDILKNHSVQVRRIANNLRKIILCAVPDVVEKALPGWHAIGFRYDGKHFCAIFPYESAVKLYFEYGAKLSDPDHILEGDTKQTRFVSFLTHVGISEKKIRKLIKEAILYLTD